MLPSAHRSGARVPRPHFSRSPATASRPPRGPASPPVARAVPPSRSSRLPWRCPLPDATPTRCRPSAAPTERT